MTTDSPRELAVYVGPAEAPAITEAVRRGGGRLVPLDQAEALVWVGGGPRAFDLPLSEHISWVQLPSAGIEGWFSAGAIDPARTWTSAAGAYAQTCAEHAVALLLAGVRGIPTALAQRTWEQPTMESATGSLRGAKVAIIGAGGIGRAMIPMLTPFGAEIIAVNRSGNPVEGAAETVPADRLGTVWPRVDHVMLAAPSTAETRHLVDAGVLAQLKPTSWVVNVARGSLIDTDALVDALANESIGGAGLDVTDPEPLPDGHPLWKEPRAIITPHVANPTAGAMRELAERVEANVARRISGQDLLGVVDFDAGY